MKGINVPVKIYTNDGEDHFYGFKNDWANNPELTLVLHVHIGWEDPFSGRFPFDLLNHIYHETNVGESELAKWWRDKGLRSLSVGDVVVLGETGAFACENIGWKKITTEELENAIIADDTEGKVHG